MLGLGTRPNIGIGSHRCRSIGCLFFLIPFAIGTDQGSRAKKRVGAGIRALGSGITTPGIGISGVFHWIKDQAFWINKILRDKGSKFSSRLEPGIKNLGKITGSGMKKYTSLRPCYLAVFDLTERTFLSVGGRGGGAHASPLRETNCCSPYCIVFLKCVLFQKRETKRKKHGDKCLHRRFLWKTI